MKCLKCGYCCISHWVVIIDDPDVADVKFENKSNFIEKKSNERCKHLLGNLSGEYSCAIHDRKWYKKTPCFSHGQIENSPDDVCRLGEYVMKKEFNLEKELSGETNPQIYCECGEPVMDGNEDNLCADCSFDSHLIRSA